MAIFLAFWGYLHCGWVMASCCTVGHLQAQPCRERDRRVTDVRLVSARGGVGREEVERDLGDEMLALTEGF